MEFLNVSIAFKIIRHLEEKNKINNYNFVFITAFYDIEIKNNINRNE